MKVTVTLTSAKNISFKCVLEIDMKDEFDLSTEECEEMSQEELDGLVQERLFNRYITFDWDYSTNA
jgi:hypothetical protein